MYNFFTTSVVYPCWPFKKIKHPLKAVKAVQKHKGSVFVETITQRTTCRNQNMLRIALGDT